MGARHEIQRLGERHRDPDRRGALLDHEAVAVSRQAEEVGLRRGEARDIDEIELLELRHAAVETLYSAWCPQLVDVEIHMWRFSRVGAPGRGAAAEFHDGKGAEAQE